MSNMRLYSNLYIEVCEASSIVALRHPFIIDFNRGINQGPLWDSKLLAVMFHHYPFLLVVMHTIIIDVPR